MGGELLEAAAGMFVLRRDGGGTAFLGLLVEESHIVHGGRKSFTPRKVPIYRTNSPEGPYSISAMARIARRRAPARSGVQGGLVCPHKRRDVAGALLRATAKRRGGGGGGRGGGFAGPGAAPG